jgi:small GTP-binding protein
VFGPAAQDFVARHLRFRRPSQTLSPRSLHRAELLDGEGEPIDDILVAGRAEPPACDLCLHLHGSPWLVAECCRLLGSTGLQERSLTERPLWRGSDCLDAEAYALMPNVLTLRGVKWLEAQRQRLSSAIDSVRASSSIESARRACRALLARRHMVDWFTRPLRVAIVGPPNAGKSTLINALARDAASIVSPHPGTTRDWVEVPGEARGMPVAWLDTAGLREGVDEIETAGIALAHQLLAEADAAVVVLDLSGASACARFGAAWRGRAPSCIALNKADLAGSDPGSTLALLPEQWRRRAVTISASQQHGLATLIDAALAGAGRDLSQLVCPAIFTERQTEIVRAAGRMPTPGAVSAQLSRLR